MLKRSALLSVVATMVLLAVNAHPVMGDIVGLWHADGNADDSSGNGNNGTLEEGVTFDEGMIGQAFSFDGGSGRVVISPNPFSGLSDFTHVVWALPVDGDANLFSARNTSFTFWIDDKGRLAWGFGGTSPFRASEPMEFGQWHHIALTRNDSTITTYIDGFETRSYASSRSDNPDNMADRYGLESGWAVKVLGLTG